MNRLAWVTIDDPTTGAVILACLHLAAALGTTAHILLTKDSPRSAAGWTALTWLSPLVGAALYLVFGINRVARKASSLRARGPARLLHPVTRREAAELEAHVAHFQPMRRALDTLTKTPLLGGNRIEALDGGEQAYPAMLEAIEGAEHSIALMTFIFDRDAWGMRFVEALGAAVARGVEVRVLIDGVGTLFSWPTVLSELRRANVPYARFLWSFNPFRMALLNLRNHRKALVVDGRVGFTGGMNIRGSFVQEPDGHPAHRDLHFRLRGPVVCPLLDLFADDWMFETGEALEGPAWYPELDGVGHHVARVIPDGPDDDMWKAELTFLQAVTCARERVQIASPYFLPEASLQAALVSAVLRGVEVDVVVPRVSNQPMAAWAMRADVLALLDGGVRVWAQEPPFDHTKLMVVDGVWSCVGSANWDPRSLRLNFEMLVEVYGTKLADQLSAIFEAKRARASQLSAEALRSSAMWMRLRDGAARLFKPYL